MDGRVLCRVGADRAATGENRVAAALAETTGGDSGFDEALDLGDEYVFAFTMEIAVISDEQRVSETVGVTLALADLAIALGGMRHMLQLTMLGARRLRRLALLLWVCIRGCAAGEGRPHSIAGSLKKSG